MQSADTPQTSQQTETAEPAVLSVQTVALMLGRSREYLYAGLREGRFPCVKFGRSRGIPAAFVRGFINEVVEQGLPIGFEEYAATWMSRTKGAA